MLHNMCHIDPFVDHVSTRQQNAFKQNVMWHCIAAIGVVRLLQSYNPKHPEETGCSNIRLNQTAHHHYFTVSNCSATTTNGGMTQGDASIIMWCRTRGPLITSALGHPQTWPPRPPIMLQPYEHMQAPPAITNQWASP